MNIVLIGQTTDNSPYSRLGIGNITFPGLNNVNIGGKLLSSYLSNRSININNPASYAFLDYTVFDVGVNVKYSNLSTEDQKANIWGGNLNYLSLAFPLRNINNEILDRIDKNYKLGMNFTLKPYSVVNYDVNTVDTLIGYGNVRRNYTGKGGTYRIHWGNSLKYNNFGFGINLGYIFGFLNHQQTIQIREQVQSLNDYIDNQYNLRGFSMDLGVLYKWHLNKNATETSENKVSKNIVFGLRYRNATKFRSEGLYYHYGLQPNNGFKDTLVYNENNQGFGVLPREIGAGMTYRQGNKFSLGFDFYTTSWSMYENSISPESNFENTYSFSIGGHYLIDERGFGNILERTNYHWGIFYQQSPYSFNDSKINQYGVTLGMSMPFYYQKNFSYINFGVEFGRKGANSFIEENYINFIFSFNFNDDQWFLKSRYN